MIKWLILLIVVLMMFVVISPQNTVNAATPTPTLRPIQPTATSVYLYLRPTPTPLTIMPSGNFDINADGGLLADLSINMYRYANRDHVLDLIGTFLLGGMTVMYIARIAGRNTRDLE